MGLYCTMFNTYKNIKKINPYSKTEMKYCTGIALFFDTVDRVEVDIISELRTCHTMPELIKCCVSVVGQHIFRNPHGFFGGLRGWNGSLKFSQILICANIFSTASRLKCQYLRSISYKTFKKIFFVRMRGIFTFAVYNSIERHPSKHRTAVLTSERGGSICGKRKF